MLYIHTVYLVSYAVWRPLLNVVACARMTFRWRACRCWATLWTLPPPRTTYRRTLCSSSSSRTMSTSSGQRASSPMTGQLLKVFVWVFVVCWIRTWFRVWYSRCCVGRSLGIYSSSCVFMEEYLFIGSLKQLVLTFCMKTWFFITFTCSSIQLLILILFFWITYRIMLYKIKWYKNVKN